MVSSQKRVLPDDVSRKPFEKAQTVPWVVELPDSAVEKLIHGFRAQDMEERWNVYTNGPREDGIFTTCFLRSWTGQRVAEIRVKLPRRNHPSDKAHIVQITWDTGVDKKLDDTGASAKEQVVNLCNGLLGIAINIPQKRVTTEDINSKPFKKARTAPWVVDLPDGAVDKLIRGIRSKGMEERWNVYTMGPRDDGIFTTCFLRSWTGQRVAEIKVKLARRDQPSSKAQITSITWETSADERIDETGAGAKEVILKLCNGMFGGMGKST